MWRARFINIFKDRKITYANSLFTLGASFSVCFEPNIFFLSFLCEPALLSSFVECMPLFGYYISLVCLCARIQLLARIMYDKLIIKNTALTGTSTTIDVRFILFYCLLPIDVRNMMVTQSDATRDTIRITCIRNEIMRRTLSIP